MRIACGRHTTFFGASAQRLWRKSGALRLVRLLASKLPKRSVQDLLSVGQDSPLGQNGLQQLGKYEDFVRETKGKDFAGLAHTSGAQRHALNIAYDEANKAGLDLESLVVDLQQAHAKAQEEGERRTNDDIEGEGRAAAKEIKKMKFETA